MILDAIHNIYSLVCSMYFCQNPLGQNSSTSTITVNLTLNLALILPLREILGEGVIKNFNSRQLRQKWRQWQYIGTNGDASNGANGAPHRHWRQC